MNKEVIEKKIENLEEAIREIYIDQMVKKDYIISHTEYKKIGKLFLEIYAELDNGDSNEN